MKSVLLVKTGEVAPALRRTTGDYERWFFERVGLTNVRFETVPTFAGARPSAPVGAYDAVMTTGSPASLTRPAAWMWRTAELLTEAAARKVPVLGVCFGHQLLAHVHGGAVRKNPAGREIGTVELTLTRAGQDDPLFRGVPTRFAVSATHEDLADLPPQAVLLAGNANTANQAMAIGPYLRGIQFHPELGPAALRALIESRRERLSAEAEYAGKPADHHLRALLAGIRPMPYAARILRNFLDHFT